MKLIGNKKSGSRQTGSRSEQQDYRTYHGGDEPEKLEELNRHITASAPEAEPQEKRRRLSGTARGVILLVVSLVVCVGTIWGIIDQILATNVVEPTSKNNTTNNVSSDAQSADNSAENVDMEAPASQKAGVYNILIVGTDDGGVRTDTIIIAHLDVNTHTTALMSVPRDTLIYGDYSVPKITAVYGNAGQGEKGIMALEDKLETVVGFRVDGYVIVDLDAFRETVDLVGGVEFDVPQDMYYVDASQDLYIDLKEGLQVLDGEHAEQLVRYRKYPEADIQRTRVQQDFLRALAKQCLSISTASKISDLADVFYTYVKTDLTVGNMVYFGVELMKCNFDDMKTYTLPGEGVTIQGGSYYQLYESKIIEIVNESFNPFDRDLTVRDINIRFIEESDYVPTQSDFTGFGTTSTEATGSSTNPTQPSEPDTEPTESQPEPTDPDTEPTESQPEPTETDPAPTDPLVTEPTDPADPGGGTTTP